MRAGVIARCDLIVGTRSSRAACPPSMPTISTCAIFGHTPYYANVSAGMTGTTSLAGPCGGRGRCRQRDKVVSVIDAPWGWGQVASPPGRPPTSTDASATRTFLWGLCIDRPRSVQGPASPPKTSPLARRSSLSRHPTPAAHVVGTRTDSVRPVRDNQVFVLRDCVSCCHPARYGDDATSGTGHNASRPMPASLPHVQRRLGISVASSTTSTAKRALSCGTNVLIPSNPITGGFPKRNVACSVRRSASSTRRPSVVQAGSRRPGLRSFVSQAFGAPPVYSR